VLQETDLRLPVDIGQAVRQQLPLTFRAPFEAPITVAVNGALMSSAWFFLPTALRDKVFTLHGTLAFALVLAGWMYSDVPSTNVLGPDATRIVLALDDPVMSRRLLYAKNIVLWLMVSPLCAVVAVISGLVNHSLLATVYTVIAIGILPFGVLAISAWVGILFPYHPMPLRYRWEHRKPMKRMVFRWAALAVTPYVLVPVLAALMLAPSLLLWGFTAPHGLSEKLPDHDFGLGLAVACAIALACSVGGQRLGVLMMQKRRGKLESFLSDPVRG
jgi:polyferredoxin